MENGGKQVRTLLFAAVAALLITTTAHARPLSKLPPELLGNWCVEFGTDTYHRQGRNKVCTPPDGYLHVRPNGFSAHETVCKLKSIKRAISPKLKGYYQVAFRCTELGP